MSWHHKEIRQRAISARTNTTIGPLMLGHYFVIKNSHFHKQKVLALHFSKGNKVPNSIKLYLFLWRSITFICVFDKL